MLKQSNRGFELGFSPIRSLVPYAREAKKQGKEVFYLNIGQPDIKTPEKALSKFYKDETQIVGYGPSEGLMELRKEVVRYYNGFTKDINLDHIYVTTGASEAIYFALMACCDQGDEVIIPEPFYANYLGIGMMAGIQIKAISSTIESGFSLPTIDEFRDRIGPKTKAIILCNPGNPTGQLYNKEELEGLAQLVIEKDLFLIVDEVYREFCYDSTFFSVLSMENISDKVIVIDSISKVFSACGARVGMFVCRNPNILETVLKFAQLRLCPPYFGQKLAKYCYQFGSEYMAQSKEEYRQRREIFYNGLTELDGVICYKPKAAFYNIIELPVANSEDFCRWLLRDFSYDNQTIMLAPANGFYQNKGRGINQVRIAYVLHQEALKKSLHILGLALDAYNKN